MEEVYGEAHYIKYRHLNLEAGFVVDRQITIVGRPVKFSSDTVYHIQKYEWDFPGGIPEKSIDTSIHQ